jgi:phage terminase large subunit
LKSSALKKSDINPSPALRVELPPKLAFLMQPSRYKVAYGGRGGAKSWNFARALLVKSLQTPLRILCTREVQRTIADSVHRLLSDQIKHMGFSEYFTVLEASISNIYGSEFLFAGLRQQDVHKMKSFEGADIVWVEEAHTVSKRSWETLIPTIRAEGSEIWVSFNPELDTDDTYLRFVVAPYDDAVVMKMTYADNPWFPAVLERERLSLQRRDPVEYEHVWEGKPRAVVEGAIYAREVTQLFEEHRLREVPYDPHLPVHTVWDLGWNDQNSIIFVQRLHSEVRLIDYEEESFLRFDEWAKRLHDKPYNYASHWLPHEGGNRTQAANGLSAQDILKPLLRMKPKLVPRPEVKEQSIRAARMMFPRVYADSIKCSRLIDCLKRYRRNVPHSTGEPSTPVHDEYSHGADAFGGLATIVDKLRNDAGEAFGFRVEEWTPADPGMGR